MEQIVRAEERRRRGGTWILVGLVVLWVVVTALSAYWGRQSGRDRAAQVYSVPWVYEGLEVHKGGLAHHSQVGATEVWTSINDGEDPDDAHAEHLRLVAMVRATQARSRAE